MEGTYQTNSHWSEPPASTEAYMAIYAHQTPSSSSSSAFPSPGCCGRVFSLFLLAHHSNTVHSPLCWFWGASAASYIFVIVPCKLTLTRFSQTYSRGAAVSPVSALKEPSEEEGSVPPMQAKLSHLSMLLDRSQSLLERPLTHLHLARNLVTDSEEEYSWIWIIPLDHQMVPLSLLRMWSPEDSRQPPGITLASCSTSKAGNSTLFLSYRYWYRNILVFSNKLTRICVTVLSGCLFILHKFCKTGYFLELHSSDTSAETSRAV